MHFHLVRHFTIASLGMFALVSLALVYFEQDQGVFFKEVQGKQIEFFKSVQDSFAKQQEEVARRDLLTIHEAGNVNLTRLFANALWERDFAPFVGRVQAIPVDQCRAMADEKDKDGKTVQPKAKKECFAEVGKRIMALPGFKEIDFKVFDSMKKSTVFKVKVFDLRGITIYSSEHNQIGEDKAGNAGWKGAALEGKPKSEMTHRDKFSAFEGVVENRDLISSYLPVLQPGSQKIVGVFEVYSDVTPFLAQINQTSALLKTIADANQQKLKAETAIAAVQVDAMSTRVLTIVVALMLVLFGALYAIVRRADAIMKVQAAERERTQQQLAQSEKMASLGQMVAGVAHQLNTPLAFSQNNVQMVQEALRDMDIAMQLARTMAEILRKAEGDQVVLNIGQAKARLAELDASQVDISMLEQMLGDTLDGIKQMSELVIHLRDFTRLDRHSTADADINKSLHTVVYIARSVIPNGVEIEEDYGALPPIECNPSQLNEVFLNLINNAAESIAEGGKSSGKITVRSFIEGDQLKIQVADNGEGIPDEALSHIFDLYFTTKPAGQGTGLGLHIARTIVREHGGEMSVESRQGIGTTFTVTLPLKQPLKAAA
jgi:two-component system, NtrC family, sensor kinase